MRRSHQPEVCFLGCTFCHRLVMCVKCRVIANLKFGRCQRFCYLCFLGPHCKSLGIDFYPTLARMTSSIGVLDVLAIRASLECLTLCVASRFIAFMSKFNSARFSEPCWSVTGARLGRPLTINHFGPCLAGNWIHYFYYM